MRTLQSRWYNFLVQTLSLDRSLFQIWVPAAPVAATDAALWKCENVIPPATLTFNRALGEVARLSDQYAAVQSQMQLPTASTAQGRSEPNAAAWSAHLATLDTRPPATDPPVPLQSGSAQVMGSMSAGVAWLSRNVLARGGSLIGVHELKGPAFRGGYADLVKLIRTAPGATGTFDSSRVSPEVSGAWAGGADNTVAGLWPGDGAPLHRKFAASKVTGSVVVGACARWAVIPAEWYQSSVLATAFSSAASPPWRPGANPSWSDLFALRGSLRRALASLIVVDAIDITMTSDARFDPDEQRLIREQAPAGIWPLYAPVTQAVDTTVRFGPAGTMSIRISSRRGHPIILGANVLGIARYLGRAD